jgi:hypothetical protein
VNEAVTGTAAPARNTCQSAGPVRVRVGATLRTVTVALELTGALTPSRAVSVTSNWPSSVQVSVVLARPGSAKEQVAPGSTPAAGA